MHLPAFLRLTIPSVFLAGLSWISAQETALGQDLDGDPAAAAETVNNADSAADYSGEAPQDSFSDERSAEVGQDEAPAANAEVAPAPKAHHAAPHQAKHQVKHVAKHKKHHASKPEAAPAEAASHEAEAAAPAAAPAEATASSAPSEAAQPASPAPFISDGTALNLEGLGLTINPPKGWEVATSTGSLSVVMREPAPAKVAPGQIKFQRNITVATIHQASPIDEKRAQQLESELVRNFSTDASVGDFKIMEHKFFNYHGTNDGLLVYSSLNLGEYPMMQMHVLISGEDKQYLMTYTDLASQFGSAKEPTFAAAWDSMVSAQVTGVAPSRLSLYMPYLIAAGVVCLLGLVAFFFRRRALKVDYKGAADEMIDSEDGEPILTGPGSVSMMATLDGRWSLRDEDSFDSDEDFTSTPAVRVPRHAAKRQAVTAVKRRSEAASSFSSSLSSGFKTGKKSKDSDEDFVSSF